jgi:hypothetical protein
LWSTPGQTLRAANDDLSQSFACHFDWSTCAILSPIKAGSDDARGRVNSLDQINFVAGFNASPIFTR